MLRIDGLLKRVSQEWVQRNFAEIIYFPFEFLLKGYHFLQMKLEWPCAPCATQTEMINVVAHERAAFENSIFIFYRMKVCCELRELRGRNFQPFTPFGLHYLVSGCKRRVSPHLFVCPSGLLPVVIFVTIFILHVSSVRSFGCTHYRYFQYWNSDAQPDISCPFRNQCSSLPAIVDHCSGIRGDGK